MRAGLTVAVVAIGAATLLGFLDGLSWVFELGTFFRLQYAVVLAALAVAALLLRSRRTAAVGAALAAVNVAVIAPFWTAPPSPRLESPSTLRLLVVNLEVGNDEYGKVAELIREVRPDAVALIELSPAWQKALRSSLEGFPERKLAPQDDAYGIGLVSRLPLERARIERFPRDGPPSVVATVRIGGRPVTIVVTHAHTPFAGSIHRRQFEALAAARPRLGERLAICGDFNAVPWSSSVRGLASQGGLTDAARGGPFEYSWPTWNPLLGVLLDSCLVSEGLVVVDPRPGPEIGSDHLPLIVELGVARVPADP